MATHSSVLAWRIPGTGEPGGLLSMGSHRVGHDWSDLAAAVRGKSIRFEHQREDNLRPLVKTRELGGNEKPFFHRERLKGIKKKCIFISFESTSNFVSMPPVPSVKKLNTIGPSVLQGPILHLGYQPPLFLHAHKHLLIILWKIIVEILINLLSDISRTYIFLPWLKLM